MNYLLHARKTEFRTLFCKREEGAIFIGIQSPFRNTPPWLQTSTNFVADTVSFFAGRPGGAKVALKSRS